MAPRRRPRSNGHVRCGACSAHRDKGSAMRQVSPTCRAAVPSARRGVVTFVGVAAFACAATGSGPARAQETSPSFPGVTCQVVSVPMRDGTLLTTYVYLPAASGKVPVVLDRNPYGGRDGDGCFQGDTLAVVPFVLQGYAGVHQEVRGTFTSQGTFSPVFQEANDGYDAVEWAAAQPWSTGRVGMVGGSYLGAAVWQAAPLAPPHLAAIAPTAIGSDYHDGVFYQNGVPDLWLDLTLPAYAFIDSEIVRRGEAQGLSTTVIQENVSAFNALVQQDLLPTWTRQLPLSSFSA